MIDFSDTPIGDNLIEKIIETNRAIEDLEGEILELEELRDSYQSEYDMLEEMYNDGMEDEEGF